MTHAWAATERRGASLISTVVALGLTVVCLTLVVHAAVQGQRFAAAQACRAEAFAACQGRLEALQAGGYAALPAPGTTPFAVTTPAGASGETLVAVGPVSGAKTVTVRVSWPAAGDGPAGQTELSRVMTARGPGR